MHNLLILNYQNSFFNFPGQLYIFFEKMWSAIKDSDACTKRNYPNIKEEMRKLHPFWIRCLRFCFIRLILCLLITYHLIVKYKSMRVH